MSHALLIAAIFIPYVALMIGLGAYICSTGRYRGSEDDQDGEEQDVDPAVLPLAA
jgi:hypothetical protein